MNWNKYTIDKYYHKIIYRVNWLYNNYIPKLWNTHTIINKYYKSFPKESIYLHQWHPVAYSPEDIPSWDVQPSHISCSRGYHFQQERSFQTFFWRRWQWMLLYTYRNSDLIIPGHSHQVLSHDWSYINGQVNLRISLLFMPPICQHQPSWSLTSNPPPLCKCEQLRNQIWNSILHSMQFSDSIQSSTVIHLLTDICTLNFYTPRKYCYNCHF